MQPCYCDKGKDWHTCSHAEPQRNPCMQAPAAAHDEALQSALRINQQAEQKLEALEEQAARIKR